MCSIWGSVSHAFKDRTPFAKACACAIIIGIGDLVVTAGGAFAIYADLVWLAGDMAHAVLPHHQAVYSHLVFAGIVTLVGLVIVALSFVWLGVSLLMYSNKQDEKQKRKRRLKEENKLDNMYKIRHSEK